MLPAVAMIFIKSHLTIFINLLFRYIGYGADGSKWFASEMKGARCITYLGSHHLFFSSFILSCQQNYLLTTTYHPHTTRNLAVL